MYRVLCCPRLAGFEGGAFNPGVLSYGNNEIQLLAKAQSVHWAFGMHHLPAQLGSGAPLALRASADGKQLLEAAPGEWALPESNEWAEDLRAFPFDGRTLINHSLIRREPNNRYVARQVLSEWDPETRSLSFVGEPQLDCPTQGMEKNWLFYQCEGRLLLFYSFSPLHVLELVDPASWRFETRLRQPLPAPLIDPGGFGGWVSWSTNPVSYDSDHLFTLVHQVDRRGRGRRYLNWGVLLSTKTLLPTHFSREPVLDGRWARGVVPGVLYPSALCPLGADFLVFCGEGDSHISRRRLPRTWLEVQWQTVDVTTATVL